MTIHIGRGLGIVQMTDRAFGIEDGRSRLSAHLLQVGILLAGIHVTLRARGGGDDGEPHHALRRPLLLQGLHIAALVVLDGVGAIVVMPLQHHELAVVLI